MASHQLPPGTDLCKIPAAVPPPGVIPKLGGPAPLAPAIVAVSAVMLAFSTIFIVGRVWINIRKLKIADCKWKWPKEKMAKSGAVIYTAFTKLLQTLQSSATS